jgi:hypothetical protein
MPSVAMRFTSDWPTSLAAMGAACASPLCVGAGLAQPASIAAASSREKRSQEKRRRNGRSGRWEGRWVPCAGTWRILSGRARPRKHGFPGPG